MVTGGDRNLRHTLLMVLSNWEEWWPQNHTPSCAAVALSCSFCSLPGFHCRFPVFVPCRLSTFGFSFSRISLHLSLCHRLFFTSFIFPFFSILICWILSSLLFLILLVCPHRLFNDSYPFIFILFFYCPFVYFSFAPQFWHNPILLFLFLPVEKVKMNSNSQHSNLLFAHYSFLNGILYCKCIFILQHVNQLFHV